MNTTIPNMILSQLGGIPFIKEHGLSNLEVTDGGGVRFDIAYAQPNHIMIEPDDNMTYTVTSYVYHSDRHLYAKFNTSRGVIGLQLAHAVIVQNGLASKDRQYA